ADTVCNLHSAAGLSGEAVNHRKAKARAAALILRCEERLASAADRCLVHAAARVFHADANILAWLEPCYFIGLDPFGTRRNDQIDPMPGRLRGIPGIQRKIEECA